MNRRSAKLCNTGVTDLHGLRRTLHQHADAYSAEQNIVVI